MPTFELERATYGPDCIAHDGAGKAVFVAGGVPGDVVEAELTSDGSRFSRARVTRVISTSPNRADSPCALSETCGGCPWARMARPAQVAAKRASVVDALVRVGHVAREDADRLVGECLVPSGPWGYRNKVELSCLRTRGRLSVGMHASVGGVPGEDDDHDAPSGVVRVKSCPLLAHGNEGIVSSVAGALSYAVGNQDVPISRVGIRVSRRTRSREVALWTAPGPFPRAHVGKTLASAAKITSVVRVLAKGPAKARRVVGVERLSGKGFWEERVGDERMRVSAPSFFQVNTAGAEKLIELVLEGLAPAPDDVAMDLYCGAGTFTLPLARRCAQVVAVEASGPAVRDLRRNLELAGVGNVEVTGGDAGREFPRDVRADLIVVDPPRAGLAADVVELLSAQEARRVAYVSCDPATLARDLERLSRLGRYRPLSVTPVDLFPQTYHIETLTILEHV